MSDNMQLFVEKKVKTSKLMSVSALFSQAYFLNENIMVCKRGYEIAKLVEYLIKFVADEKFLSSLGNKDIA